MARSLLTVGLLALVWIIWSWHFEPLVLGFGVVAVISTVLLAWRLKVLDKETVPFEVSFRLLGYIPWLLWQIIVANVATARLILHPKMPLRPHLIRVPADQRTAVGRVIYANTITITPGTISLDLRDGVILVHCLDDAMATEETSSEAGRIVQWLERRLAADSASDLGEDEE